MFYSSTKTTILFVVRDFVGVTPMEALEAVILEEINKIWDAIEKVNYNLAIRLIVRFLNIANFSKDKKI